MATITSVGTGAWSASGTWDAGVPADGDDVVIDTGHTVTFDVDQSGFSTGVKVTITGTLTHTTASGTYCLYLKAGKAIEGTGTWNIGTSATPIPLASKHTITGLTYYIDAGKLTINIYGATPTYRYCKLTSNTAAGGTVYNIDTDLTADIWADGDTVTVFQTDNGVNEERVIAVGGISSNSITITAGSDGKNANSYLILKSRNIVFSGTTYGTAYGLFYYHGTDLINIKGGLFESNHYIFFGGNSKNVSESVFYYVSLNRSSGLCNYTNCVFYLKSNDTSNNVTNYYDNCLWVASSTNFTNNCIVKNSIVACFSYGMNTTCEATFVSCLFEALNYASYQVSSIMKFSDCTFQDIGTGTAFRNPHPNVYLDNCIFNITSLLNVYKLDRQYIFLSERHDQTDEGIYAYTSGGSIISQTSVMPSGYDIAYLLSLLNSTSETFFYRNIYIPKNTKYNIEVQLRKSASMSYLPKAYLMDNQENPINGQTPVDSFTMTDSTDTWETDTFVIDNSAVNYGLYYTLWFVAKDSSGSVYSAYKVTPEGGGGTSSVKILPFMGKVGL